MFKKCNNENELEIIKETQHFFTKLLYKITTNETTLNEEEKLLLINGLNELIKCIIENDENNEFSNFTKEMLITMINQKINNLIKLEKKELIKMKIN